MATVRGIVVVHAVLASLATVSVCVAGAADDTGGALRDQDVAPNHSASVDNDDREIVRDPSACDSDPQAVAGDVERPLRPSDGFRGGRRGKLERRSAGVSDERQTPWYRTGLGALAIVLTLLGGATWAFRRWMPMARAADSSVLRVVARASLSPKQNLALIRVGRRFVLVGASGDRVNVLCDVCDPEEVAELTARCDVSRGPGGGRFDELLVSETADYAETVEPRESSVRSTPSGSVHAREPLNDLLRKLRTLRSG